MSVTGFKIECYINSKIMQSAVGNKAISARNC